jgi:hypothetical protein
MEVPMDVFFQSRDAQAKSLNGWAVERVRFTLRRWTGRVSRAQVLFSDVDGQRHGVDKRCQVEIVPNQGPRVVVVAVARNWHAALMMALARAVQTLQRHVVRRRDVVRAKLPLNP